MKKAKRISIMVGISAVMLFAPSQISAQNIKLDLVEAQNYNDISKDPQVGVTSLLPKVASFLAKVLINFIGSVPLHSHPGYVSDLGGGDYYVTHPSVDYNQNGIGTIIRKDVLAYGQDILRPYMQKEQILAGKVGIQIYNSSHVMVDDKQMSSGLTFDYKVPGGYDTEYNYYIHYAVHNKERWTPRMFYINIVPPCLGCGTNSIEPSKQVVEFSGGELTNKVMKDNRIYIKQSGISTSMNSLRPSKSLTMNELYTEFYDGNTRELTDQAKTLSPGSQVKMIDVIEDISYHKDEGYTEFKFKSEYSNLNYHSVYFNGDLSNEYKIGNSIELTFNVVKTAEINGNTFVDLDYNLEAGKSDVYPSIDSFLR